MSELGDYIAEAAAKPHSWATHDCCTFIADWSMVRGWPDPMAFIRGKYQGEAGALRAVERGGGLVRLVNKGMRNAKIPEVKPGKLGPIEPHAGDVGVIDRPTTDGANVACAIFSGERWISLAVHGIDAGPAVPLKVWRPWAKL